MAISDDTVATVAATLTVAALGTHTQMGDKVRAGIGAQHALSERVDQVWEVYQTFRRRLEYQADPGEHVDVQAGPVDLGRDLSDAERERLGYGLKELQS